MKTCNQGYSCRKKQKKFLSWLPAIIIAILPKCPFCIMAYSGAVSMCSGKMIFPNAQANSFYIILSLGILILLSILFNNKGQRTQIATFIVSIGILLLVISQNNAMSEPLYYLASFLLFFGIWYNGSFLFFYKKYFQKFISLSNQNKLYK